MTYNVDRDTLDFIYEALRENVMAPHLSHAERLAKRITEKGWAFHSDVEDLLGYLDSRLNSYRFNITGFSRLLGLHWESVCFRPSAKSKYVFEYQALRAADAAMLLILLERMGFHTHPTLLVDLLLPSIKSKGKLLVNSGELEVYWFYGTRYKTEAIRLTHLESVVREEEIIESFRTITKYKVEAIGLHLELVAIEISSPRFRRPIEPIPIICPECGLKWHKGDPDSSVQHRKEHKKRLAYLQPQPSKEIIAERDRTSGFEWVTDQSPVWKHKEMYIRAQAFRREFGYDFVQWQDSKGIKNPFAVGFLFVDEVGRIVGACSFLQSGEQGTAEKNWRLDWIWICPTERRNGHVTARWNMFRERFGDFSLSHPVSDTMKSFLAKQGDLELLNK